MEQEPKNIIEKEKELRKRAEDLLGNLLEKHDMEKINKYQTDLMERVKYLQDKYPDSFKYVMLHALIGSTVHPDIETKGDFPGEDSVEKFINLLEEKYK